MTEQKQYDYDYFVIGAGSGGVRSARIAAANGAKVGIAEARALGGTGVNLGCVPKKLMSYASHYSDDLQDMQPYGWSVIGQTEFDWARFIKNKNDEISRLNGIYENILKNNDVDLINGYAKFIDNHTLDIDGKKVTADKILIAVGGTPFKPDIEGSDLAITSDELFYLENHPRKTLIYGGGYIALEFACILNGLGSEVHVVYRGELPLKGFDVQVREKLMEAMKSRGINFHLETEINKLEKNDSQITAHLSNSKNDVFDTVLFATGRVPLTKKIGLENTDIEQNDKGGIVVNKRFQTKADNIYAVGDVINRIELTPVAIQEGHFLADQLFKDQEFEMDYNNIATAIFTTPPIGTVGLSEEDAKQAYGELDIYESSFRPMKNVLACRDERTFMKLIVDPKTDLVLGCHMLGDDAPEIIQMAGIAMQMCATKADFDKTMAVHPTSAEEFVTMRSVSRKIR